jgi:predicted nucleotidyltransferase
MKIIFVSEIGSVLHGLQSINSDYDIRGVYSVDLETRLSIDKHKETMTLEEIREFHPNVLPHINYETDSVFYEVTKFFKMCSEFNINAIEILFSHSKVYENQEYFSMINKSIFYSYEKPMKFIEGMKKSINKNIDKFSRKQILHIFKCMFYIRQFFKTGRFITKLSSIEIETLRHIKYHVMDIQNLLMIFNDTYFETLHYFETCEGKINKHPKYDKINETLYDIYTL